MTAAAVSQRCITHSLHPECSHREQQAKPRLRNSHLERVEGSWFRPAEVAFTRAWSVVPADLLRLDVVHSPRWPAAADASVDALQCLQIRLLSVRCTVQCVRMGPHFQGQLSRLTGCADQTCSRVSRGEPRHAAAGGPGRTDAGGISQTCSMCNRAQPLAHRLCRQPVLPAVGSTTPLAEMPAS